MSESSRSRRVFPLLAAVALLAAMLAPVTAHAGPTTQFVGTGDIQGTVRDVVTGMPITWDSDAQTGVPIFVEVWRDNGGWWEDLSPLYGYPQTLDNGTYYISGLPEGDYYLRFIDFWNTGYRSEFFSNAVDVTGATVVTVTDGGVATANISLEKIEFGAAAGMITGMSDGLPIDEVYVYGYALDGFGDINWDAWGSSSLSLGDWYVDAPAGQYKIWFEDPSGRYLSQYYGGGTDFDAAPWVTIAPTHTTPNLNVAMVKAGHITGTITGPGGPLKGAYGQVYTWPDGNEIAEGAHQLPTNAQGEYDYGWLPAGDYTVVFVDPSGRHIQEAWDDHAAPGLDGWEAAQLYGEQIHVNAGQTVLNIDAQLAAAGWITGTVTDPYGPVPWTWVEAYDLAGNKKGMAETEQDGTYVLGGLAGGLYKVKFYYSGDDGLWSLYHQNWYSNQSSWASAGQRNVVVGSPAPGTNASLVPTANWGSVSGTVRDAFNIDPLPGMLVALDVPDGGGGWIEEHTTYTDASGHYSFRYVPMGQYRIRVTDEGQWQYGTMYADYVPATPRVMTLSPIPPWDVLMDALPADMNGNPIGVIQVLVRSDLGAGLAGVPVTFYEYDSGTGEYYSGPTVSTPTGGFVTAWVPVGTYAIEAGPAVGYVAEFYNNQSSIGAAQPVVVTDGSSHFANIVLGPDNRITGTVRDGLGDGIEGARVEALRLGTDGMWTPVTWDGVTNAFTADDGEYTLYGLPAGQYKVAFTGWQNALGSRWWRAGTTAQSPDQAGIITLAGTGDLETNIDATLTGACTLRGSVVNQDGDRANGIKVKLWWNDPVAGWAVIQSTYAYNNGDIGFYGFSAGEYRLEFLDDASFLYAPGWYHNVADMASAEEIPMADGQKRVIQQTVNSTDTKFMPISGTTRILTAIKASQGAFEDDSVTTVVIATGYNWPDALGGAALAGAYDGPILLTSPKELAAEVLTEIERLGAEDAIILGGTSAVSSAVETSLKQALGQYHVRRVSGSNRYETAVKVAEATVARLGAAYDGTAFVSTGENFPDVLGAAPLSAAASWPIYLTDPDALTPLTTSAMQAHHVDTAIILGGKGAVSLAVESSLKSLLGSGAVVRLGGATRYETAVKVAQYGVDHVYGLGWNNVAIATGQNYPDALSGGVLQGRSGSVLLLTPTSTLDGFVAAKLAEKKSVIVGVRYLGGENAVSTAVRNRVQQILY